MARVVINPQTAATGTVTVVDNEASAGATLTLNGVALIEGVQWTKASTADLTASNIASAINGAEDSAFCLATSTGPVVTITYDTFGTSGNSVPMSVSDSGLSLSGATLSGGLAPQMLLASVPIAVKSVRVNSSGTALDVNVLNGITAAATEYDTITGTSDNTVVRNYNKGLHLPSGCYLVFGADVVQLSIEFSYL